jgi:hypothetical protein
MWWVRYPQNLDNLQTCLFLTLVRPSCHFYFVTMCCKYALICLDDLLVFRIQECLDRSDIFGAWITNNVDLSQHVHVLLFIVVHALNTLH